uniref:Uncharacterized protein n=1 Tax=Anguilla anguilla TaxID=7936 RepID=A0A0E9QZ31_ANGAN
MGLTLNGRYISLFLAVRLAYLLQAVGATGNVISYLKASQTACSDWDRKW